MRPFKILVSAICLAALLITVTGCFSMTADELYSLPQASKEYLNLQELISSVLSSGAEYAPPTSGQNRQSVQLKDIDGDGENEAIAFFRTKEDKPLKIYIMKQVDGTFETINKIEGDGTSIESILYEDLDGDGANELIVGWQITTLLHMMIYSIKNDTHIVLAEADYSELVISDLNSDGKKDVIALRLPSGEAEMITLMADGEPLKYTALLSKGIESITRIKQGLLYDKGPAVYVEGNYAGNIYTDILTWQNDTLVNVSVNPSSGVSEGTLRTYEVYTTDINKDGIMEFPSPNLLDSVTDTKYYVIDWYSVDRFGTKYRIYSTYHNFSDKWYLILPEDWKDQITVRRDDSIPGERTIIFTHVAEKDEEPVDFLKIYTLSGENRNDRAKIDDRFRLFENSDTIYAAEILETDVDLTLDKAIIKDSCKPIEPDWSSGVA